MITQIGSQAREPIEDTEYMVVGELADGEILLFDSETGKQEIWAENDHYAGYVLEIGGIGYEFARSID